MIRSIVFDIGEVLVDFNWESYTEGLGFDKDITKRLKNATVRSELWNEQDRGDYDFNELVELHLQKDPQIKKELQCFFKNIAGIVKERDFAVPLLKQLKENGYHIYLLSNYGKYAFETAGKQFAFLNYIDGKVISYQVGLIKPDKAIYRVLLNKYSLKPEETIFIDDKRENIESAKELGFQSILFLSRDQVLKELEKSGVKMLPN